MRSSFAFNFWTAFRLLCLTLGLGLWTLAPPAIASAAQTEQRQIAFDLLNDPTISYSDVEQVCCGKLEWQQSQTAQIGVHNKQAWIKLPALAAGDVIELSRGAQLATLFEKDQRSEQWLVSRAGELVVQSQKSMPVAETALRLSELGPEPAERYLLIEQPSNVIYTLDVWSAREFAKSSQDRMVLRLILLGFCGAMAGFNFIVSVITRQRVFALNAAMIVSLIPLSLVIEGTGAALFWPESPELTRPILIVSRAGSVLFSALFLADLLAISGLISQRVLRTLQIAGCALCIGFLSVLVTGHAGTYIAMILASGVMMLAHIILLIISFSRGDREALLYLMPTGVLLIGLSLRWAIMLFSLDQPWLRHHILEATLAFEAMAFSLILANKIRAYAAEASQAREQVSNLRLDAANQYSKLQDDFRSNVASALHDSVGHSLAIASAQLTKMKGDNDGQSQLGISTRLESAQEAVAIAIAETRRISHELHPARLEHLGLKRCLEELIEELDSVHDIKGTAHIDVAEGLLGKDRAMHLYRVAQEASVNIVKHSRATQCNLTLLQDDRCLHFTVSDNGMGIPDSVHEGNRGIGLFSMQQRVLQMGGELQIDSQVPGGVTLSFKLALAPRS